MLLLLAAALTIGAARDTTHVTGSIARSPVHAMRTTTPMLVDGRLDEEIWSHVQPSDELYQRQPHEGKPASQRTDVRVVYDDAAIYIGAHMYDTAPDSIRSPLLRRDRYGSVDRLLVFLDPYHDRRTGVYFGVSAAGTQYDGTMFNDDWDDDTWDAVWVARTRRVNDGWVAEMRIPLSQLRFSKGAAQVWGINFKRDIARSNEQDFLVFPPLNSSGFVSRFADLTGLERLSPGRGLAIIPYVTARGEYLNVAPGDPLNSGHRIRGGAGADAVMAIGANLTLNATVNPDFGQVEVDPAVVNLTDAEVFFEERRPFFVQGANIFNYGVGGSNNYWGFNWSGPTFFYSRRIGRRPQGVLPDAAYLDAPTGTHIDAALKLSGKLGGWSLGVLGAMTRREFATYADSNGTRGKQEIEPRAFYGVARVQREFNAGRQGLGFMSTLAVRDFADASLRDQVNRSALAFGLDGWTFLDANKAWVVTGWATGSTIHGTAAQIAAVQENSVHYFQRPDVSQVRLDTTATSLSGWASRISLNHQKGNVTFNAAIGAISPGLELNDLGFQTRTDRINGHVVLGYRWTKPTDWYQRINGWLATSRNYDFGGNLTNSQLRGNSSIQFKNFSDIYVYGGYSFAAIDQFRTRGGPLMQRRGGWDAGLGYDSDDRKPLSWGFNANASRSRDSAASGIDLNLYAQWRPAPQLTVTIGPEYTWQHDAAQYLGTFADQYATETYGNRYLFGDLDQKTLSANIRANWIFTPRLSLEVYAQPLVSSGRYRTIRELAAPRTFSFVNYREAGGNAGNGAATYDRTTGIADPDGAGPASPIALANPDFTFASLRGNAVLRWEYMPGSTIFLVWTQNRSISDGTGEFRPGSALGTLFAQKADNIFLVKATYWWSR